MNDLNLIDPNLCELNETTSAIIFSLSDWKKSTSQNGKILQSSIKYIFAIKWFDESLF